MLCSKKRTFQRRCQSCYLVIRKWTKISFISISKKSPNFVNERFRSMKRSLKHLMNELMCQNLWEYLFRLKYQPSTSLNTWHTSLVLFVTLILLFIILLFFELTNWNFNWLIGTENTFNNSNWFFESLKMNKYLHLPTNDYSKNDHSEKAVVWWENNQIFRIKPKNLWIIHVAKRCRKG